MVVSHLKCVSREDLDHPVVRSVGVRTMLSVTQSAVNVSVHLAILVRLVTRHAQRDTLVSYNY